MVPGAPALQIDFVRFTALSPFFIHYSLLFLQHPTPAQVYFRFNDFVYDVADNIKTFFLAPHLICSLSLCHYPCFLLPPSFAPYLSPSLSSSLFLPFSPPTSPSFYPHSISPSFYLSLSISHLPLFAAFFLFPPILSQTYLFFTPLPPFYFRHM